MGFELFLSAFLVDSVGFAAMSRLFLHYEGEPPFTLKFTNDQLQQGTVADVAQVRIEQRCDRLFAFFKSSLVSGLVTRIPC